MFVNQADIDWLTLTTWSETTWIQAEIVCRGMGISSPGEARRMQYRGLQSGNVFWGEAKQKGRRHWMVQISGMDAAIAAPRLSFLGLKCTRIDLQITVPKPADWNAIEVGKAIRAYPPDYWGRGGQKNVTVVQSGDGFDTIYIGNRQSDRYCRIYVKPDDTGRAYLRFEMEYKRDLAQQAWQGIQDSDAPYRLMAGTLLEEIRAIPGLYGILPESMLTALRSEVPGWRPSSTKVPSGGSGLAWLTRQVQPAIMRLMADHDQGSAIRQLIRSWAWEADAIDTTIVDILQPKD